MNFVVNNYNVIEIILIPFIVSFFLVYVAKKLANHVGALDMPNERKIHKVATPRLGGLAIFCAFLFGYIAYGALTTQMLSILIGAMIVFVLGLLDDIKPLSAISRFIVQIIAACIVVYYGKLYFDELSILGLYLLPPLWFNKLLSVFFIVGAINAFNLIDGMDGLCSGLSCIYFATIAIIAFILNRLSGLDVILCLIMFGSTLGFLFHNFPPAKIFMGDCGSTFLGFMISVIGLLGFKSATITSLVIPILVLAIPIFDTLFAILRRVIHHKSIGEADKKHLHHQLLKMKFSPRVTILIIYGIDILFSAVSIFYVLGDNQLAIIIYFILLVILLYIVLNTDILFEHHHFGKRGKNASNKKHIS